MPLVRWLLPLVAVLALLGSSVSAWAAAGVFGESECCCPVKAKCKCHDHDKKPDPVAKIKRCSGEADLVAPAVIAAVIAAVADVCEPTRTRVVPSHIPAPIPDERTVAPDTPPF